jgi:putative spermidine/putrescine transport system substrate-binding protein
MFTSRFRLMTVVSVCAVVVTMLLFVAVSSASAPRFNKATATSAQAFGGMAALVKAAQKEGTLNVIALPPDWADYGKIIAAFKAKYHIKVNSANPDGNSQDEINAIIQLAGTSRAPDVVDVGANVMLANTKLFTPYKVAVWSQIPKGNKDAKAVWYADYTGYESIGYNADLVSPAPKTVKDLLKSAYKGMVALNGDPTLASAGFHGVVMASLANGGSVSNIKPGVDFFARLKKAGNFLPVDPTPATIASGQTPIVIDWDYNQKGAATSALAQGVHWKWVIPANNVVSSYYLQAINKKAPHPAAARLWEEFLYSTVGQNWFLRGGAHPVLQTYMTAHKTIDRKALAAQPKVTGTPVALTQAQLKAAQTYLLANWNKAIG